MKNLFLLLSLIFSFLFSFSQNTKKYKLIENDSIVLKYNNNEVTVTKLVLIDNYIYFTIIDKTKKLDTIDKNEIELIEYVSTRNYKIDTSKIEFVNVETIIIQDIDLNSSLVNFSSQAQTGLIIQLIAPILIVIPTYGIYGVLGLNLIGMILHIDSHRYIKQHKKNIENLNNETKNIPEYPF